MIIAAVGDVHGQVRRMMDLVHESAQRCSVAVDLVLQVGDFEANRGEEDRAGRATDAELGDFPDVVRGTLRLPWPLWFIGGNHEPYRHLDTLEAGTDVGPGCRYLGRWGRCRQDDLRIGWVSGIMSPRFYDCGRQDGTSPGAWKRLTYFSAAEVQSLVAGGPLDLLLIHDWPQGLIPRGMPNPFPPDGPKPWFVGNKPARTLVEVLRPQLVLCGHLHTSYRAQIRHEDGTTSQVICLSSVSEGLGAVALIEVTGSRMTEITPRG